MLQYFIGKRDRKKENRRKMVVTVVADDDDKMSNRSGRLYYLYSNTVSGKPTIRYIAGSGKP